jgi:hypothetical protein
MRHMEYVKLIVVVLHVASAALLFGAPLGLVRMARTALEKNDDAFKLAAIEAGRRAKLTQIGSLATLVTGLSLIFLSGGFAIVSKNFHAALGVTLLAIAFSLVWMRPNTMQLVRASAATPIDKDSARKALAKLGMGGGILQGVWLLNLTLMFLRF